MQSQSSNRKHHSRKKLRILFVTPEISHVPHRMSKDAEKVRAKAGGLADVSALLVESLYQADQDIHLAIPNYRHLFSGLVGQDAQLRLGKHIHLAEDGHFYSRCGVYQVSPHELLTSALVFQREIINHVIPDVKPDIIHCNDWLTGLIPAVAKRLGIPTLFTIHNVHSQTATLADMENRGIPVRDFWQNLYFTDYPHDFDHTFWNNGVDFLASGIFAADHVNVVSPSFLDEIASGYHAHIPPHISHLVWEKREAGCASGIMNAPDSSFHPESDNLIPRTYTSTDHAAGKRACKAALQHELHLSENPDAPLIFWPSRLDPTQKGCQLFCHILHDLVRDYSHLGLQFAIIADGPYQRHFHDIVTSQGLQNKVAVRDFSERLSHLAYAASDFLLMPSSFEPCGLPQMIGMRYGTLPIVHRTGGLRDTVCQLDTADNTGNGFLFETYDCNGLRWAIDQALFFFIASESDRSRHIARIMQEAREQHDPKHVVDAYLAKYEELWQAMQR